MATETTLPVLDHNSLTSIDDELSGAGVRLLVGSMVDSAGVLRSKQVPVRRVRGFHSPGVGASPTWNVFCIDNAIAFTSRSGVTGDLRLRIDLGAWRLLGDGVGWAPAEFFDQQGLASPHCARGLLRRVQAEVEAAGLSSLVGCELEFVLTGADGAPLATRGWEAYGLSAVFDQEPFLRDVVEACEKVGLPLEQIHAEYGDGQYEVSLGPSDPLSAADNVVLTRIVLGRVARRHGLGVSFSPLPFVGGTGNGAHQHLSFTRGGEPLFSGGSGPHGLTADGGSAIAGIVNGLPELLAVFAGSVLSSHRLLPGHWSGAFACWGLENREAAVRFCAATPGNPRGANVEVKCVDPSANPYLSTAAILGLALEGLKEHARLPVETSGDPASEAGASGRAEPTRLTHDQGQALADLAGSALAARLLGDEVLEAVVAVRQHERERYQGVDVAELAALFRFAWSA